MIGGTGPTGIPLVRGLVARGADVTIMHRGLHERDETPTAVHHVHVDPYDEHALTAAASERTYDVVVAMYGRLRRIAAAYEAAEMRDALTGLASHCEAAAMAVLRHRRGEGQPVQLVPAA